VYEIRYYAGVPEKRKLYGIRRIDPPVSNPSGAGRRFLLTGAASGIGRATALRLARDGNAVGCLDLQRDALHRLRDEIAASGGSAAVEVCDVADGAQVERAVAALAGALGGLDAVGNIAGIGGFTGDVTETEPETWARNLDVNLTAAYLVARTAIPHLRAAGGGSIVNVSSQFGLVGCLSSPAYCAAKAGLIGLTRAMALDHAADGIRVNAVCPGPVDTAMLAASGDNPVAAERERARTAHRNLIGRPSRPEEVAATIAFIASGEAGSITGSVVSVDGGWLAG
jgi:NAD(P)-dependent dehydrogenase (short-subunit alcohol dehydrogenase family)